MSIKDIYAKMMRKLPNTYDKTEGTVISDIAKVTAMVLDEIEEKNQDTLKNMIYDTATEEWKEKIASDRCNIDRWQATFASGICEVKGDAGAVVNIGDKVSTDTLIFTVTKGCVIDLSGTGQIEVSCDTEGAVGNVPARAINSFPITLSGVYEVYNEETFDNGHNKETIESLDARYHAKRKNPGTSGNKHHYKNWALEVTGVGDCKVYPRTPTRGTVTVVIIDSNKVPASESLVSACQSHIEEQKPCTADVIVSTADSVEINISVSIMTAENDKSDYTEDIKVAVNEYLKGVAFKQSYVSYAQIGDRILSVSGIQDYFGLTVNDGIVNITIPDTSVAVMGGVTIV